MIPLSEPQGLSAARDLCSTAHGQIAMGCLGGRTRDRVLMVLEQALDLIESREAENEELREQLERETGPGGWLDFAKDMSKQLESRDTALDTAVEALREIERVGPMNEGTHSKSTRDRAREALALIAKDPLSGFGTSVMGEHRCVDEEDG